MNKYSIRAHFGFGIINMNEGSRGYLGSPFGLYLGLKRELGLIFVCYMLISVEWHCRHNFIYDRRRVFL